MQRVWLELGIVFQSNDEPIEMWLTKNQIDVDEMLEFLDDTLRQMVFAAYKIAEENKEDDPSAAFLSIAASLFFMGWEMNRQLGQPSSHVAE